MKLREILGQRRDFKIVCRMNDKIKEIAMDETPGKDLLTIKVNQQPVLEFREPNGLKRGYLKRFFMELNLDENFGREEDVCEKLLELDIPDYEKL